jgi:hypothetical protein
MKTIADIDPNLQHIFKKLMSMGWKQPTKGYIDSFVLECPKKGWTAHQLTFPESHVGIISKGGTTLIIASKNLDFILKNLKN